MTTEGLIAALTDQQWVGPLQHCRSWQDLDTMHEAAAAEIGRLLALTATQSETIAGLERDLAASRLRAEQLFQELGRLRRAFRANVLRLAPGTSHAEIDAVIEGAKGGG